MSQELREQIGIYQQGNKTTVVIFNLRESTKRKLVELFAADVKASPDEKVEEAELKPVETVTDLEEPEPDLRDPGNTDVSGMENAAVQAIVTEERDNPMQAIWRLIQLSKSGNEMNEQAAREKIRKLLHNIANTGILQFMQQILYGFRMEPEFSETLEKIMNQKGCGTHLQIPYGEYDRAVQTALMNCEGTELSGALYAIAERYTKVAQTPLPGEYTGEEIPWDTDSIPQMPEEPPYMPPIPDDLAYDNSDEEALPFN